jgi:hypothetical protein
MMTVAAGTLVATHAITHPIRRIRVSSQAAMVISRMDITMGIPDIIPVTDMNQVDWG